MPSVIFIRYDMILGATVFYRLPTGSVGLPRDQEPVLELFDEEEGMSLTKEEWDLILRLAKDEREVKTVPPFLNDIRVENAPGQRVVRETPEITALIERLSKHAAT